MKNFKRFLSFALPYKWQGFFAITFNVFYALFTALSYVALMPTLSVLFGETKKRTTLPEFPGLFHLNKEYLENYLNYFVTHNTNLNGTDSTLGYLVFIIVFVFLLKNIFGYLGNLYMTFLKNNVLKDIRDRVFEKIISLPVSYFSEKRKGDVIARATNDIGIVNSTYLDLVIVFIREPLNIVFTLIIMFSMSWELSLFMFTFIPVSGFVISRITKKIKEQAKSIFSQGGEILSSIEESITGLKIIKAFNAEDFITQKYHKLSENVRMLSNKMGKRAALSSPTSEFLGIATISCLLWFGGRMVLAGESISSSAFIVFMALSYNILTPAKTISKANNNLRNGNAAGERVIEILDSTNPLADQKNAIKITGFEKEIVFDNISFKYDQEYVLKNFSLTIPKGKTVALVGQSGSGKSTLANLITRFWDVNKGKITIDGIDIKNIDTLSLRAQMGIVAQEALLFNDTIKNNIALGVPTATDEVVIQAAKVANAHEFIKDLPLKYESPVGDSGGLLSGGQKQRIAIARAVFKNPPIMILDEATSALDTESEHLVQQALENMMENRTSIVIAHRLSTIQNADVIVVLKKGEIIEQGKHEDLLALKGNYYNLVNMQSLEA
ncbi:ABC transporter ATP-binding protein [Wenyingzhuangia sp. 2_MG-2023]|uniref:ABC transporter ATP-binding protein n=1 Tax=Wenyingzhuangia sp. 2_MG-2023 TaxID=3062639 RepID=UPI0026E3758B|nr:ABC transporter ATP-binding protein [Wenyingzhuangia sp. 2_MG-2023]MDO6738359.1 ABC transporter ATP-binding protein [Wenyingzhuangia sp. 2_MG-2023]